MSFSAFACGVIVTDSVPDGVVPVVETPVPDSVPVAVGTLEVSTVAVAPENVPLAE